MPIPRSVARRVAFAQVLESIGLAPLVPPKTTLFADGLRALESIAKGKTAMAVASISEIHGTAGVALVGPLPGPLQQILLYAAGVLKRSPTPDVAQAFLAHLKTASARAHFESRGIDPAK